MVGDGVELRDRMTAFFVLSPSLIGSGPKGGSNSGGDHAAGQRFFGTYPVGQFRFLDGRPSLHLRNGDAVVPPPPAGGSEKANALAAGSPVLLAYRLDGGVEISVGGGPW
ncbi:unnamed protein product, partial [Phaeothamnion confervicola]